jgi:NTP pyrophosphatase (non-canonical NTP hydrolase)
MSTPTTTSAVSPPYQVCVECETEYATAAVLVAAHARVVSGDREAVTGPWWLGFCPACLHDFVFCPFGQVDLTGHAAVMAECLRRNGFDPGQAVQRNVVKLAEEAGEVAGAYLRCTGQARRRGTTTELHEEVADVILTAFSLAHALDMDINAVITAKLDKIHTRGWRETTPATHPTSRVPINLDGGAR